VLEQARQPQLSTARLLLRRWRERDRAPFAAINADAEVMRLFPATLTAVQSGRLITDIEAHFERHGFGLWALEHRRSGELLGFTGLCFVSFEAAFTPAVEVGWRLRRSAWGHGYASEAAIASLAFGFSELDVREVVSFTSARNERSRAVIERIGMTRDLDGDFAHPMVPSDSPLLAHVLYRISAGEWRSRSVA
jgi:RimJ/RimL family protein N-acetyltransferase